MKEITDSLEKIIMELTLLKVKASVITPKKEPALIKAISILHAYCTVCGITETDIKKKTKKLPDTIYQWSKKKGK